jgi:polar amino acid transport system substrate-binding protein
MARLWEKRMRKGRAGTLSGLGKALALAILLGASTMGTAWSADTAVGEARVQLAPTGKLRAAIGVFDPALATRVGAVGELAGATLDIARALADRLGVPLQPVAYDSATTYEAGLQFLVWDISLTGREVSSHGRIDFSANVMLVDNAFLARPGKSFRDLADIDRKDMRVGVTIDSASDLILTRKLANALVFRVMIGTAAASKTLRDAGADVFAASVPFLTAVAAEVPGATLVEPPFSVTQVAIGVAPGRPAALAYVNDFVREAKASGLIRQAVERAALKGVRAAPP